MCEAEEQYEGEESQREERMENPAAVQLRPKHYGGPAERRKVKKERTLMALLY